MNREKKPDCPATTGDRKHKHAIFPDLPSEALKKSI